ncbi:FAD binding domain-containing protein [Acetohalobium arabaticum]|uniref:Molybdopterin dehydrogenase FAD-binding protein n=1 Tax=Acetohalobium arabaticum (strain ATCC 49924 / DSM 5501 / Z-7288) TaxID=574087 RepID=D9QUU6_ACEAZ|nr:xanthine dehydrogenase family protein subunit M [Acetohalobium arabaticum]ADL12005.1 molybdopterin dehydrogenase FAD-binding protein [Acetohalobium arabaticum DSM 5501]
MRSFDYYRADTVDEAISLLQKFNGEAVLLAGGTDVIVEAKEEGVEFERVVDISRTDELRGISLEGDKIHIGAATKFYEIVDSEIVRENAGVLARAANKVGSVQTRNMGTIGGNVGNAAPSADSLPSLLILDAQVVVADPEGEKCVPVNEIFEGPGETVLNSLQMIKEIIIPCVPENTGMKYIKHMRRKAMDVATVGCAVRVGINPQSKKMTDVYIALGSVAPTPILVEGITDKAQGKKLDQDLAQEIGEFAMNQVSPITDVRSTKEYRNEMVKTLVKNALMEAYDNVI